MKPLQRTLKVAHVTTVGCTLRYGLLNQLAALQQAGYDVCAISAWDTDIPPVEAAGFRHIPVSITRRMTPIADLLALWQLFRTFRRERFDIVHTHTPKPGLLGQLAARLAGVPVVMNTVHGFYFHEHSSPPARRLYVLLERVAGRCSDAILSQSGEDVETAIRERICPPARITRLGNGIDVTRFDRRRLDPERISRLRCEFGIRPGDCVVGFVGRLVAEKGLLDLLQAGTDVCRRLPHVKFLIVGPVDDEKRDAVTPAVAAAFGLADRCIFTGRREDMPDLYAMMDVFVLPSHREGFPRSVMEAMAMGVPSIATDIRGCREAIEHQVSGLLVPPREPSALAEAVFQLLSRPAAAQALADAGWRAAQTRFDERHVFDRVVQAYRRAVDARHMQHRRTSSGAAAAVKRAFDLIVSVVALLLTFPVALVIALLLVVTLRSTPVFSQRRVGRGEREFWVYKFRSMTDARDAAGVHRPDAERLTTLGRWLRRTSLDELPQLWNVIRGDLSLVGPRPLLPRYLPYYSARERLRHMVRPGITGWAQIHGRNAVPWRRRLELDVWYVEHWSLWLDARILWATVPLVLRHTGVVVDPQSALNDLNDERTRAAERVVLQPETRRHDQTRDRVQQSEAVR